MPDCDRTPAATLTDDVRAVVERWNPAGGALLRSVPAAGRPGAGTAARISVDTPGWPAEFVAGQSASVTIVGPDDANTTLLRTELSRFEPRLALSDPVTDPAVLRDVPGPGPAVVLVLLDAGAAAGTDIIDPMARLQASGTRILFAMNGVHAHPDWRSILQRDAAMLAHALGTEPEIVPVSARLAVAARGSNDAALLDRSGLAALHAQLSTAVGTQGPDRLAGATARILADTRARVLGQIEALRSGTEVARLRAQRTTALAGRDGGRAQALAALRNRLQLARVDLTHEVGARVRTLNATARADLERLDRGSVRDYPERLQQLVNEATTELDALAGQRLGELARQIEAVTGPAPEACSAGPHPGRPADPAPRVGADPEGRPRGVEDRLMIALGASAGFGLGRLVVAPLSLVPALDIATVPITLALGAGVAWWVVRARGHLADRAHLRQWVTDVLVNVKAQLEQRVATALVEAESELTDRVVHASTARMVETDQRVAELEGQLRRAAAEQPAQLAACERDLAILDAVAGT